MNSGSATRKRPRFSSTATGLASTGRPPPAVRRRSPDSVGRPVPPGAPRRGRWSGGRAPAPGAPAPGGRSSSRSAGGGWPRSGRAPRRWQARAPAPAPSRRVRAHKRRPAAVAQCSDTISRRSRCRRPRARDRDVVVDRVALGRLAALWPGPAAHGTIWPSSMKTLETSTASDSSPPPFPRRSRTMPVAPSRSVSTSRRTRPWAPLLKLVSSTTPSLRLPRDDATRYRHLDPFARPRCASARFSDRAPQPTCVPDGPLMRAIATSLLMPVERPSTATISSPRWIRPAAPGSPRTP